MNERHADIERIWETLLAQMESSAAQLELSRLSKEERRAVLLSILVALQDPTDTGFEKRPKLYPALDKLLQKLRVEARERQLEQWMKETDSQPEDEPIYLEPVPAEVEDELKMALDQRRSALTEEELVDILQDLLEEDEDAMEETEEDNSKLVHIPPAKPRKKHWRYIQVAVVFFALIGTGTLYWDSLFTAESQKKAETLQSAPLMEEMNKNGTLLRAKDRNQLDVTEGTTKALGVPLQTGTTDQIAPQEIPEAPQPQSRKVLQGGIEPQAPEMKGVDEERGREYFFDSSANTYGAAKLKPTSDKALNESMKADTLELKTEERSPARRSARFGGEELLFAKQTSTPTPTPTPTPTSTPTATATPTPSSTPSPGDAGE